jgi:acyl-CoA hydrolase
MQSAGLVDLDGTALAGLLRPGARLALGDGAGSPIGVGHLLSELAREHQLDLLLGWMPALDPSLDLTSFQDVRAVMGGWALRRALGAGVAQYVPARMGAVPSLVRGALRPDVLVARVVPVDGGFRFGTEVSWLRAAVEAGAVVAGLLCDGPCADAGPPIPPEAVKVVGPAVENPATYSRPALSAEQEALAFNVAGLIPSGARVQVAPGGLGEAVLERIDRPVSVDSGVLGDGVMTLARRGLLVDEPIGTYLLGSADLYRWADGRRLLHPIEHTHNLGRLATGAPLVAVNTAFEIDRHGQANVEGTGGEVLGGVGGQPDYAAAGALSVDGLSVLAVLSRHGGRSTFVSGLDGPVTCPAHDVDLVVTEQGHVDLRGRTRAERCAALTDLFGISAFAIEMGGAV